MYSVHVATTSDRDLPPPELGRGLTWDRLTEILLREVSADAASLFAEPIRDEARDQTHWHITAQDDPKPISALSEEERNKLMLRLTDRRREIGRFADKVEAEGGDANLRLASALRSVLVVPDERQHIWSADGKPVLTAWGRRPAKAQAAEARFVKRPPSAPLPPNDADSSSAAIQGSSNIAYERNRAAAQRPVAVQGTGNIAYERGDAPPREARDPGSRPPPPQHDEAAAPSLLPPPPMIVAQRRFWAGAALWALFVLLVAGSYYALLPACGVQLPLIGSLSDRCNFGRSAEILAQEQRNFALRDSIAKAELEIAQKDSACATTRQRAAIEPPLDSQEALKRRPQAASGRLDITLLWNGREDLDLHVYCPGGHIFFNGRSACGGTLDIDRNSGASSAIENPLEHVIWAQDPPRGNYRVEVALFDRFNLPERQIPFKVLLRDGADEREFTGEVHKLMEMVMVTSFTR